VGDVSSKWWQGGRALFAFQPDVRHAPPGYGVTAYGPKLARAAGLNLFFFQILVICLNILEIRSNF
jgi:hypothetical protein